MEKEYHYDTVSLSTIRLLINGILELTKIDGDNTKASIRYICENFLDKYKPHSGYVILEEVEYIMDHRIKGSIIPRYQTREEACMFLEKRGLSGTIIKL